MALHTQFTTFGAAETVLARLAHVHPAGHSQWRATCPAHGSGGNQALSIRAEGDKVLLHCFGGCPAEAVLARIGLTWQELHTGSDRPYLPAPRALPTPTPDGGQCTKMERLWQATKPLSGTCAGSRYLASRGLPLHQYPAALRLHPGLEYHHNNVPVGRFPALLARVEHLEHGLAALHRTYLAPDGTGKADVPSPKKLTRPTFEGATKGAAIRLYSPSERLALAEGLETALAVYLACGWPVWACVSAGGMERVILPSSVKEVLIAADHDGAGIGAAQALARRLLGEGRTVRLAVPPTSGADWLDVLNAERGAA